MEPPRFSGAFRLDPEVWRLVGNMLLIDRAIWQTEKDNAVVEYDSRIQEHRCPFTHSGSPA